MKNNTKKILSSVTAATLLSSVPAMAATTSPKPSTEAELSATRAVVKLNTTKGILDLLDAQKLVGSLPNGEVKTWLSGEIAKQISKVYTENYVDASRKVIEAQKSLSIVDLAQANQLLARVESASSKNFLAGEIVKVNDKIYTEDYINAARAVTAYRTAVRDGATAEDIAKAKEAADTLVGKVTNEANKNFLKGEITKIDNESTPIEALEMSFGLTDVNLTLPRENGIELFSGREDQNTVTNTLSMKDQHGKSVSLKGTIGQAITVDTSFDTTDGGSVKISGVNSDIATVTYEGNGDFKVEGVSEGSFTVKAEYTPKDSSDVKLIERFKVTVAKAGATTEEYRLDTDRNTIDADEDETNDVSTLSLYQIDENGNLLDTDGKDVTYKAVKDVDGIDVSNDGSITFTDKTTFNKTGVISVNAYVDGALVDTIKINYTNSDSVATLATVVNNKITVSQNDIKENTTGSAITLKGILNGFKDANGNLVSVAALAIKDQNGKVFDAKGIAYEVGTSNLNNVEFDGTTFKLKDDNKSGSVNIILTKVNFKGSNILDKTTTISLTITK